MALKVTNLSHSSISSFVNCPRSWAARNIEGAPDVSGEEARFGDAFDKILCEDLGFPVKEYRDAKGSKVKAEPGEYRSKFSTPEVEEAIKVYRQQPWAWNEVKETQRFIQITPMEWERLADKYGGNPYIPDRIIGFIDMVRYTPESEGLDEAIRPLEVCDLKTTGTDTWKPEWARQCVLYALATGAQRWSIHRVVRGRYDKMACRAVEMNSDECKQLVKEVMDHTAWYAQQIKDLRDNPSNVDHLPRNAGYHCKYCPLADGGCKSGEPFKGGTLPGKFQWSRVKDANRPTDNNGVREHSIQQSLDSFLG